ncbi:MAG: hypothetical protein Q9219_005145 [cf. Caloplaca sp. 3 TL-2023]
MTAADEDVVRREDCRQIPRLRGGDGIGMEDLDTGQRVCDSWESSSVEGEDTEGAGIDIHEAQLLRVGHGALIQTIPLLSPLKIQAMVDIVRQMESAISANVTSVCNDLAKLPSTPAKREQLSTTSSPLSSAPSSPCWPTPSRRSIKAEAAEKAGTKRKAEDDPSRAVSSKVRRAISSKASPYFVSSPKPRREAVSCIPFPPLSSLSFGLVQESLASDPFHLLIAVIFLNKTRGAVAMPVFYTFIARFPEPASLASASHEEVVGFFQNLGLQNQRAKKCIALAKAWLVHPPIKGKRWRRLHYPMVGDGKDIKGDEEPIVDETEDSRVAWEVGHLPGIGAYGIDSWRIFCRDELRGLGNAALPDLPADLDDSGGLRNKVEEEELKREWTRVLPTDKELRAYLRWRWLRIGWEWDPKSGERRKAAERVVQDAVDGGVIYEGEQGWSLRGEDGEGKIRKMGDLSGSEHCG